MCGIAGEIAAPRQLPDRRAVERMTDVLTRGPRRGRAPGHRGRVALGHRRLKIIDLSDRRGASRWSMSELGLTIVFNGCIYNYPELRAELVRAGHDFSSSGDTEVLVKGWREWGEGLLERLQGMFALALVDHRTDEVVLVRDRLGHQAAVPARDAAAALRFASTLPALLAGGGVSSTIDPVALHHYLTLPLGRAGAPHDPERGPAAGARRRSCVSAPTASGPAAASGTSTSTARRQEGTWAPTSGVTPCSTRCAWPCSDGRSLMCRWGSCSRAGSTRA